MTRISRKQWRQAWAYALVVWLGFMPGQTISAQPIPEWIAQAWYAGSSLSVRSYAMDVSESGTVRVTGLFPLRAVFEGVPLGPDTSSTFIVGYDQGGQQQWVRHGVFRSEMYYSAQSGFAVASGTNDAFYTTEGYGFIFDTNMWTEGGVALNKYSADGTHRWTVLLGDSAQVQDPNEAPVYLKGLGVDGAEHIYVAGEFRGTLVLGDTTYTSASIDLFLASYDADGVLRWSEHISGPHTELMAGILSSPIGIMAVSAAGGVYIGGFFSSGTTFNSGKPTQQVLDPGGFALAKYDASGVLQWVRTMEDLRVFGEAGLLRAAVDAQENLYLAWFMADRGGTLEVTVGDTMLSDPGFGGAFLTKYDPDGNLHWVRQFKSEGNEFIEALATDDKGSVYVGGSFDALTLDLGEVRLNKQDLQADKIDGFVAIYNTEGALVETLHAAGEETQRINALATDAAGNLYVTGEFEGTMVLGRETWTARGGFDLFVAKYAAATITKAEGTAPFPEQITLEQNYPNPFTASTSITFTLPAAMLVDVRVYDILGREVATVFQGHKPVGVQRLYLEAGNLPSGVYFYRLQTGMYQATKSMVLKR